MLSKQRHEMFRVFDLVPDGLCVFDRDHKVYFWNRCLEEASGIRRDDIIGKRLTSVFDHLATPTFERRISQVFDLGTPAVFSPQVHRYLIPCPDQSGGFRYQQVVVSCLDSELDQVPLCLMSVQDVSEFEAKIQKYRRLKERAYDEVRRRERIEKEMVSLQETVLNTRKLLSLSEMAGGVAHEINNPLAIINGAVHQLLGLDFQKLRDPTIVRRRLSSIANAVERISTIVRSLMMIYGAGDISGVEEELDLNLVADDAIEQVKSLMGKRLTETRLERSFEPGALPVIFKRERLLQAISNLLINAVEAAEGSDSNWVRIATKRDHETIVLTVEDGGAGHRCGRRGAHF